MYSIANYSDFLASDSRQMLADFCVHYELIYVCSNVKDKGSSIMYTSIGTRADPGLLVVSSQMT